MPRSRRCLAPGDTPTPRRKPLPDDGLITMLVHANPKRPWGAAYRRFDLYRDGMTVREFLDLGGTRGDLWYDQDHDFIRVS